MPVHWWGMNIKYWVKCMESLSPAELALILREKHPSRVFHNCSRSITSSQSKKQSESHLEGFHIYLLWDWERKTRLPTVTMVMAPQAFLMILHFIVITFLYTSGKNLNHYTLGGAASFSLHQHYIYSNYISSWPSKNTHRKHRSREEVSANTHSWMHADITL